MWYRWRHRCCDARAHPAKNKATTLNRTWPYCEPLPNARSISQAAFSSLPVARRPKRRRTFARQLRVASFRKARHQNPQAAICRLPQLPNAFGMHLHRAP